MNELNAYTFFLRSFVSAYMQSLGVELFMTRTVHEVLWGFKDPLLTKLHSLKPEVDEYFGLMWKVRVSVFVWPAYFGASRRKLFFVLDVMLVIRDYKSSVTHLTCNRSETAHTLTA